MPTSVFLKPGAAPAGTVSLPGFFFTNDRDTGFYSTAANKIGIAAGGAAVGLFASTGLFLGTATSNAFGSAVGNITLKHGDNLEVLTFKRTSVAHGVTSDTETDTYGLFVPRGGAAGGLSVLGLGTNDALLLKGVAVTPPTTVTAEGVIDLRASKKSGTTTGAIAATDVGWSFTNDSGSALVNIMGNGIFARYAGVTTAGWGVPGIYASGRATAQTARSAALATYTVGAADGSFLVSANVLITASTTHSFVMTVAYTDESNTARTLTLFGISPDGLQSDTISNVNGPGPWVFPPVQIRCKAATTITIRPNAGTFTTVTYNAEGLIQQVA